MSTYPICRYRTRSQTSRSIREKKQQPMFFYRWLNGKETTFFIIRGLFFLLFSLHEGFFYIFVGTTLNKKGC